MIARRQTAHGSGLGRDRWVVERTFAWLHNRRRLLLRTDRRHETHEAFLDLACCLICCASRQASDYGRCGAIAAETSLLIAHGSRSRPAGRKRIPGDDHGGGDEASRDCGGHGSKDEVVDEEDGSDDAGSEERRPGQEEAMADAYDVGFAAAISPQPVIHGRCHQQHSAECGE